MKNRIKTTLICKEITNYVCDESIINSYKPKIGDVAIFEILEIGKHKTVQSESRRIIEIVAGDYIMATFANRYATEQFEGYIPTEPTVILDILGAGGSIGIVKSKNAAFKDIQPTKIRLIGYAKDDNNKVLNTMYYKTERKTFRGDVPNKAKVILSVGSSMDSGKTTSAAYLARGLKTTGKKIAYIKLTGTGYTKDKDLVYDCGADVTVDFTDAGIPSTFKSTKQEIMDLYQTLLDKLAPENPDFIIMEIADGIIQCETEFLLQDKAFMKTIHSVMFSGGDSLATLYGVEYMKKNGINLVAVCGMFTMSPLLIEEVRLRCDLPILNLDDLSSGEYASTFGG